MTNKVETLGSNSFMKDGKKVVMWPTMQVDPKHTVPSYVLTCPSQIYTVRLQQLRSTTALL
jgi:hypothetical protein